VQDHGCGIVAKTAAERARNAKIIKAVPDSVGAERRANPPYLRGADAAGIRQGLKEHQQKRLERGDLP